MYTVMIRLIQQVWLVSICTAGKNRMYFTLGYVISRPLLSRFDSNNQQVALVNGTTWSCLILASQLNFMQSV